MKVLKPVQLVLLCAFGFLACQKEENSLSETGTLIVETTVNTQVVEITANLKSTTANTLVDDYWIYLYNNDVLQESYPVRYADLPAEVELSVGSYRIVASSVKPENIVLPTRDASMGLYYAGETTIDIIAEQITQAEVVASQAVVSVTVEFSDKFKQAFSEYSVNVSGIVFDENNMTTAYYEAGNKLQVELIYTDNEEEKIRYFETSKAAAAGDHWLLSFDASGEMVVAGNGAITLSVLAVTSPQSEVWEVEASGTGDGPVNPAMEDGTPEAPYSVETARTIQDGTLAWVQGYIVGFVKSSTNVITAWTDATDTNIAIADQPDETDINKMLFVRLESTGTARSNLGLNSTQGVSLGMFVKLNGKLETYYSSCGITGVNLDSEYVIVE